MTTSYEALRTTLDALENGGVTPPRAEFRYHGVLPQEAKAVIDAVPNMVWQAEGGQAGGSVWIRGRHGVDIEVVLHLAPVTTPRPDDPTLTIARNLVAEATS